MDRIISNYHSTLSRKQSLMEKFPCTISSMLFYYRSAFNSKYLKLPSQKIYIRELSLLKLGTGVEGISEDCWSRFIWLSDLLAKL